MGPLHMETLNLSVGGCRQSSSSGAVDPTSQTATSSGGVDAYGRSGGETGLSALQKQDYSADSRYAATSSIYNSMIASRQITGQFMWRKLPFYFCKTSCDGMNRTCQTSFELWIYASNSRRKVHTFLFRNPRKPLFYGKRNFAFCRAARYVRLCRGHLGDKVPCGCLGAQC